MELLETNIWWILLIVTVIFIFIYKKISKNPDAMTSRYEAVKRIKGSSNNLVIIMEALKNAGFKKVGVDQDANRFYAQTKFSMSSWTEYIEVVIIEDQSETEIKFKSICAYPTQIYDWGKNKRNYKKFEEELEKIQSRSKA